MSKVDILSASLDISNSEVREFIGKLELLLNRLLVETGDYKNSRPTDGIILENKTCSDSNVNATGIVVMIDGQYIEPIKVRLEMQVEKVSSASIYFGVSDSPKLSYDSKEHNKFRDAIIANPDVEFNWKYSFYFDGEASAELLEPPPLFS